MRNTSSSIAYELIYISFNAVKWGHIVRHMQTRDKKTVDYLLQNQSQMPRIYLKEKKTRKQENYTGKIK